MNPYRFKTNTIGLYLIFSAIYAYAEPYSIEEHLKIFDQNTKYYMNQHKYVQKYEQFYIKIENYQDGNKSESLVLNSEKETQPNDELSPFSKEMIENKEFVNYKSLFHEGLRIAMREGRASIMQNDRPEDLVDNIKYRTIHEMDFDGLRNAHIQESPWSGDYWPIFRGQIASRYADPYFPGSKDWRVNAEYILSTIRKNNISSVQALSPSEKYDLLIGDSNFTLTKRMIQEGESFFRASGTVETWMGICHGWAAASFMMNRPKHAIELMAWDNHTKITFYPSDIKALASLLWAKSAPPSKFIGSRCNKKNPPTDENGRLVDQECFETNPGSWHLTIVNQLGVNKKPFVIDANHDYEIWNQPVYSYEYSYFNPYTRAQVRYLKDAIIPLSSYNNDKFYRYRNLNTVFVVGIAMKLVYIAETRATLATRDGEEFDRRVAVNYLYDLELDTYGNIIGGEWYHNQHPNFMWVPATGAKANAFGDRFLEISEDKSIWFMKSINPIPSQWREAALKSSSNGQVLRRIVEEMIEKARTHGLF
jgi:hypothetical protein